MIRRVCHMIKVIGFLFPFYVCVYIYMCVCGWYDWNQSCNIARDIPGSRRNKRMNINSVSWSTHVARLLALRLGHSVNETLVPEPVSSHDCFVHLTLSKSALLSSQHFPLEPPKVVGGDCNLFNKKSVLLQGTIHSK